MVYEYNCSQSSIRLEGTKYSLDIMKSNVRGGIRNSEQNHNNMSTSVRNNYGRQTGCRPGLIGLTIAEREDLDGVSGRELVDRRRNCNAFKFGGDPGDDLIECELVPLGVSRAKEGIKLFFGSGVCGGRG